MAQHGKFGNMLQAPSCWLAATVLRSFAAGAPTTLRTTVLSIARGLLRSGGHFLSSGRRSSCTSATIPDTSLDDSSRYRMVRLPRQGRQMSRPNLTKSRTRPLFYSAWLESALLLQTLPASPVIMLGPTLGRKVLSMNRGPISRPARRSRALRLEGSLVF